VFSASSTLKVSNVGWPGALLQWPDRVNPPSNRSVNCTHGPGYALAHIPKRALMVTDWYFFMFLALAMALAVAVVFLMFKPKK
jgi:hypothetical protein